MFGYKWVREDRVLEKGERKVKRGEHLISLDEKGMAPLPEGMVSGMSVFVDLNSIEEPMRKAMLRAVKNEVETTAEALAQMVVDEWLKEDDNGQKFAAEAKSILQRLPALSSDEVYTRVAAALKVAFQKDGPEL